jgi:hypothetical protein
MVIKILINTQTNQTHVINLSTAPQSSFIAFIRFNIYTVLYLQNLQQIHCYFNKPFLIQLNNVLRSFFGLYVIKIMVPKNKVETSKLCIYIYVKLLKLTKLCTKPT